MNGLPCLDWRIRFLLQHHDGTYHLRLSILEWFLAWLCGSLKAALYLDMFFMASSLIWQALYARKKRLTNSCIVPAPAMLWHCQQVS